MKEIGHQAENVSSPAAARGAARGGRGGVRAPTVRTFDARPKALEVMDRGLALGASRWGGMLVKKGSSCVSGWLVAFSRVGGCGCLMCELSSGVLTLAPFVDRCRICTPTFALKGFCDRIFSPMAWCRRSFLPRILLLGCASSSPNPRQSPDPQPWTLSPQWANSPRLSARACTNLYACDLLDP